MRFLAQLTLILVASTLFVTASSAEEPEGFTLYSHLGQTIFEDDLDDEGLFGIGVGYRFDSPWAIELTYQQTKADYNSPFIGNANIDLWHLGALYHLRSDNNFVPFLSFGLGNADYDNNLMDDRDDTQANAGIGMKWNFNENAAIRGDLKIFGADDDGQINAAVSLGLHYAFGSARKSAPMKSEPVMEDGDADGDGVLDSADRCPGTPSGVEVDSRGCPRDDDGDGVYNYMDDCPTTTDRRAKVDARGCYIRLEKKVNITLKVEFDFDSSKARDAHTLEVKKVADFMNQYPHSKVVMEGHTDSLGRAEYNQKLSERRAATIADMLVQKFNISTNRVSSVGHGESKPIASNDTEEGRQHNRRVVAAVEGQKQVLEMK